MHHRRAQIVVAMRRVRVSGLVIAMMRVAVRLVIMVMMVIVVIVMVLSAAQQPRARDVDQRPATAIGMASRKWIATGATNRVIAS